MATRGAYCFKASTAILNTLLRVLNEGVYDFGDGVWTKVPLLLGVASSNEWPNPENGRELDALFDRFPLRATVQPIATERGLRKLLWSADDELTPKFSTSITPAEILVARNEVKALAYTGDAKEATHEIIRSLKKEGIKVGDRRKRQGIRICQAYAYLMGATSVQPQHLSPLADVYWNDPQEQPEKAAKIVALVANPAGMKVSTMLSEVEDVMSKCNIADTLSAATAASKLQTILKDMKGLGEDPRVLKAIRSVETELKELRLATAKGME